MANPLRSNLRPAVPETRQSWDRHQCHVSAGVPAPRLGSGEAILSPFLADARAPWALSEGIYDAGGAEVARAGP